MGVTDQEAKQEEDALIKFLISQKQLIHPNTLPLVLKGDKEDGFKEWIEPQVLKRLIWEMTKHSYWRWELFITNPSRN
ncbi:hypothetical protein AgCh_022461 [Apium graveolens]